MTARRYLTWMMCALVVFALAGMLGMGGIATASEGAPEQPTLPVGVNADQARGVTIERLASADVGLSESVVTFRGEAVGEPVSSSTAGSKWVLMQDSSGHTSSIEVLMTADQVALIDTFGGYQKRGTTLLVTGIYRVADPAQMGALDVTAYAVSVVAPGDVREQRVNLAKLWWGLGLVATGAALMGLKAFLGWRSRS